MYTDFHAHFDSTAPDDVKAFVQNCEANDARAVMTGGWMGGDRIYAGHDEIKKYCSIYSERLLPAAKIDLWDQKPDTALLRKLKDEGFVMAKFICPYYEYDHDLYMPVYEELEKLEMPALFHTGIHFPCQADVKYKRPMLLNMDPLRLDRLARSFPKLRIVAAHMGTTFYRVQAAQLVKVFPNVYTDLAGSGAWKGLLPEEVRYYLRDIMDRESVRHFAKLIFGSDCYVSHPEIQTMAVRHYLNIFAENGLPQEMIDAIMGGTVSEWLGI